MKVIEILKLNKGMLKTCRKVGIRMEDVQLLAGNPNVKFELNV